MGKEYELVMEFTLYHSDHSFIGRTCASRTGQLVQSAGKYETKDSDYVILHLSFAPEKVQVLVELVVYEVDDVGRRLKTTMASVGWGILPVKAANNSGPIELSTGTPRLSLAPPVKGTQDVFMH